MPRLHFSPRAARGLLALLFACASLGCGPSPGRDAPAAWRQSLELAQGVELQLGEQGLTGDLRARIARAAAVLEGRSGKRVRVGPLRARGEWPRVVLGRPTDPTLSPLLFELGAEFEGEDLHLGQAVLRGEQSVLQLCVADPDRPGLPVTLLLAKDPGLLDDCVEDLAPLARPGLVLRHPRRPAQHFDVRGQPRAEGARFELWPFAEVEADEALVLFAGPDVDRERLRRIAERSGEALQRIAQWTGTGTGTATGATAGARLELLAVDSVERMRDLTGRADLAVATGPGARIALLVAPGLPDDGGAAAARWAVARSVHAPGEWWLDGLALDAAGTWWGRPLLEWGGHLRRAELMPEVERIVAHTSAEQLSQHVLVPARGLLCRYLRLQRPERWRSLLGGEALVVDEDLGSGFEAWLAGPAFDGDLERRTAAWSERRGRLAARAWQNGVALDSNAREGGGFDGRSLEESLRGAVELGADSVSITSEYSARPIERRTCGARWPAGRAALEGDAALAHAVASARRAGARSVLLQPHLLLSESGGYSAWLRRTSAEHWEEFFDELEPMLAHYALLAELLDVELLCVGTELTTSNANEGLDPATKAVHDRGWAEAIELARRSYGGALTYGAGWPAEARAFPHWRALDYVGVSLFPRFASLREAPPETSALRRQWGTILAGIAELSAREERPALIVEMGLRSTVLAGTETAVGAGPADGAEQARLWAGFSAALGERRAAGDGPAGLYLWKWPAAPGVDSARGYSPRGKPAQPLLRALSPRN